MKSSRAVPSSDQGDVVPFTVSHVAAILPLTGTPLVGSALAIGSMAPDFPYYLPLPEMTTHSLVGVVTVDPLLGLAAYLVWHALLVRPAWTWAPQGLRRRWSLEHHRSGVARLLHPRPAAIVALSLVIGSATHVFWDSFTHPGRWGVRRVPWLAATHGPMAGYHWAQYASGAFGAAVIVIWLIRWWRATPETIEPQPVSGPINAWLAWIVAGSATVVGALVGLATASDQDARTLAFGVVTRSLGCAAVTQVLLAIGWRISPGPRRPRG